MKFPFLGTGINWRKSPAHLLLLTKFMKPSDSSWFAKDAWNSVLGESSAKAIDRFVSDKVIQLGSVAEKMDAKFKVTELKEMLQKRDLPVSGNKPVLIQRLIENDPAFMKKLTNNLKIYYCTAEGKSIAEAYKNLMAQERDTAEKHAMEALKKHKWEQACQIIADYEAAQVFPRGMNMDWKKYNSQRDLQMLSVIFEKTPKILIKVSKENLQYLRIAAALMYLWGTNDAKKWLPQDFNAGLAMDTDASARMLVFHSYHLTNLARDKSMGIKRVKILGANDGRTCKACKAIVGKTFSIDKAPELPNPECTCIDGCRCTTIADI